MQAYYCIGMDRPGYRYIHPVARLPPVVDFCTKYINYDRWS